MRQPAVCLSHDEQVKVGTSGEQTASAGKRGRDTDSMAYIFQCKSSKRGLRWPGGIRRTNTTCRAVIEHDRTLESFTKPSPDD
jgi:hypothetical protein